MVEDSSILKKAKGWQILAGTNQQYEFSAWQEGLGYLKNNISGDFSTIFLNDTVLTHRYFSVARKFAFLTGLLLFGNNNKPRYIGFTNKLKDKSRYTILNYSATSWVSTYLFFMNNLALQAIDYKIWSKEQNEQSVNGGYNKQNFFSESISQNLKEWLIKWLFEDGGWYKSEPLSEANYKFFEIKAKSIINEKYLSAKLNSVGGQIIDPFIAMSIFRKIDRVLDLVKFL